MEADMKLLTLNVDPVDIPEQEYDAVIRMTAVDLHRICKDFKDCSATMRIQTKEEGDGIIFSCDVSTLLALPIVHCLQSVCLFLRQQIFVLHDAGRYGIHEVHRARQFS